MTGAGMACPSRRLDAQVLRTFLSQLEYYSARGRRLNVAGNARTLEIIDSHLPDAPRLREAAA